MTPRQAGLLSERLWRVVFLAVQTLSLLYAGAMVYQAQVPLALLGAAWWGAAVWSYLVSLNRSAQLEVDSK